MKNSSLLILLFSIALIGVTANFLILINYTSKNVEELIYNEQKILTLTKSREVIYRLNKYYFQLKRFIDKASANYINDEKIKTSFQRHIDKLKFIKAFFLISDNKVYFSYPAKISQENIVDVHNYINNNHIDATLVASSSSIKFIDSLPERLLFVNGFKSESDKNRKNVYVVTEIDINKILHIKEKGYNKYDSSIWMLGSSGVVLGSSKQFNNRGLATVVYKEVIADKRFSHIVEPFKMFGNIYKIVLTHNKKLIYESIYPLYYNIFFVGIHLLMIAFILAILFGIVSYEFIFSGLNERIVKLNIKVDEIEKQKIIEELASSDSYFQNIYEIAKKMKEKSDEIKNKGLI